MIKNISFDLWSTLIKGNPTGVKKHEYFYSNHNPLFKSQEEVKKICDWVKIKADRISEATGITVMPDQIVADILYELGNDIIKDRDLIKITINECKKSTLLPENLPLIYDENTLDVLNWLRDNKFNLIAASNTGFLSGEIMSQVLYQMGLYKYFTKCIFSDQVKYSKPSMNFFSEVNTAFGEYNYLHVGDNPFADGGATRNYIINSNNKTILDLKDSLEFSLKLI